MYQRRKPIGFIIVTAISALIFIVAVVMIAISIATQASVQ